MQSTPSPLIYVYYRDYLISTGASSEIVQELNNKIGNVDIEGLKREESYSISRGGIILPFIDSQIFFE
jgi:hypothetical protein